ncbi:MAG: beta-galactosidase trimerization domain-containing protein, partial [Armatimonadota bacterium]|nr:beta-galactosidase trimerization domain-containing protein [Armatimonadota bacterium]
MKPLTATLLCCTLAAGGAIAQTGAQRLHEQMPPELWDPAAVDWVNDVAVLAMPYMGREHRETLLRDFDLDMLDWYCGMSMNAGKFFRHRGIRCSAPEEYEYQEALQFSRPDTVALFENNGIAITLDGSVAHFPEDRYGGAQFMTHLAPKWHEVVKQGMARVAPFGDSVTQDNIGVPLIKGNGNFSDWANRQFQRWLRDRYDRAQLAGMGVDRVSDVHMRTYVSDLLERGTTEEALEDRLVREYIRFMYFAHLQAWLDCATAAKRRAANEGLPIPAVYGNQWGAWGTSPYATIQSQYTDVVWIEGGCVQPPFGHTTTATAAMFYKVGRAAGDFRKPVWTIEYPGHSHPDSRLAQAVVYSDAFSNGGFVVGLWGMGETSGPRYEVNREYFGLAGDYRPLFTRREQLADVAVVWNFPSHYWRSFSSLRTGIANQGLVSNFFRMLEDLHIPYEAIIFGHRDVFDDSVQLDRLARYRVIIVPAADCMSDRHARVLKRLAREGATVVLVGETGTRDEDYEERERAALTDVIGDASDRRVAFGDGAFVVLPEQFIDDWHGEDREQARQRL